MRDEHLRPPRDIAFTPNVGAPVAHRPLAGELLDGRTGRANIGLELATALTEHHDIAVFVTGALVPALDDPLHELRVSAGGDPEQESVQRRPSSSNSSSVATVSRASAGAG